MMRTPSRSVLVTGLQTADSGMPDNCDVAWVHDLPTSVPTIGHMLRKAGYCRISWKRGSVRTVFDGRYKFSRYFAPIERNSPASLDDLYAVNEVELFDLDTDPAETRNLAADRATHAALIETMSGKLEALIKAEIGRDDGREMPDVANVSWAIERPDL